MGARIADLARPEGALKAPPRMTPSSQTAERKKADPLVGISSALGVQQSSTHSQALPCISNSPHGLGLKPPTGTDPWVAMPLRQASAQKKRESRSANLAYAQSSLASLSKL